MVCWFIHGLNQIKSCQEAFEVSGKLVRWATNMNIEIPTDHDLVIFWENVSQKLRELMNKALIKFRRAIDNCTQHRTIANNCSSNEEYVPVGRSRHLKLVLNTAASPPPRTAGWKELRERTVITWFKPGFSQQEEIQGIKRKSHLG